MIAFQLTGKIYLPISFRFLTLSNKHCNIKVCSFCKIGKSDLLSFLYNTQHKHTCVSFVLDFNKVLSLMYIMCMQYPSCRRPPTTTNYSKKYVLFRKKSWALKKYAFTPAATDTGNDYYTFTDDDQGKTFPNISLQEKKLWPEQRPQIYIHSCLHAEASEKVTVIFRQATNDITLRTK